MDESPPDEPFPWQAKGGCVVGALVAPALAAMFCGFPLVFLLSCTGMVDPERAAAVMHATIDPGNPLMVAAKFGFALLIGYNLVEMPLSIYRHPHMMRELRGDPTALLIAVPFAAFLWFGFLVLAVMALADVGQRVADFAGF